VAVLASLFVIVKIAVSGGLRPGTVIVGVAVCVGAAVVVVVVVGAAVVVVVVVVVGAAILI
jgi:hypothetical protein